MSSTGSKGRRPPSQGRIVGRLQREYRYYRALLEDPRTSTAAKWLIGGGVGYVLLPFDLIPDFIPVIGKLDDILIASALIGLGTRLVPTAVRKEDRDRSRRVRALFDDQTIGPVIFQCDAVRGPFGIHISSCGRDAETQGPVLFPLLDLMYEYGLVTLTDTGPGDSRFDGYTLHTASRPPGPPGPQLLLDVNFRPFPLVAAIMYNESGFGNNDRFVNTKAAYLALPPKLKRQIQCLRLRWQPYDEIRLDAVLDDDGAAANTRDGAHVVAGAQFLNLLMNDECSFVGLSDTKANQLLSSLREYALQDIFCYTHLHSHGDLIAWNPRQILHVPSASAKGMPEYIYPRTLSETIVAH